jgi:hypothetical protein
LRALPEDEVCRAFDVGLGVELGTCVGEERVLIAEEGDGVVALSLRFGSYVSNGMNNGFNLCKTHAGLRAKRNSLRPLSKSIPHIDIVQLEIARPDSQRPCEIIVRLRLLALRSNDRDLVLGILRVIGGIPLDRQWSTELRDVDLFGVGAWVDENDLRAGRVRKRGDGC